MGQELAEELLRRRGARALLDSPRRSALRCLRAGSPAGDATARRIALAPPAPRRRAGPGAAPRERAEQVCFLLEDEGAEVLAVPLLELEPPTDPRPLRAAAELLRRFGWVAFASERSVTALVEAARTAGTLDVLRTRKLAAVGPGTAATLAAHGLEPTLVAGVSTGEGLAEALVPRLQTGELVLLPAAEEGRRALEEGLAAAGAVVERVAAYRSRPVGSTPEGWGEVVAHPPRCVLFGSPRTVEALPRAPRGAGAGPAGQGGRGRAHHGGRSPGAGLGAGGDRLGADPPGLGGSGSAGHRGVDSGLAHDPGRRGAHQRRLHAELRPRCAGAGEAADAEPGPGRAHEGAGRAGPGAEAGGRATRTRRATPSRRSRWWPRSRSRWPEGGRWTRTRSRRPSPRPRAWPTGRSTR